MDRFCVRSVTARVRCNELREAPSRANKWRAIVARHLFFWSRNRVRVWRVGGRRGRLRQLRGQVHPEFRMSGMLRPVSDGSRCRATPAMLEKWPTRLAPPPLPVDGQPAARFSGRWPVWSQVKCRCMIRGKGHRESGLLWDVRPEASHAVYALELKTRRA